MGSYKSDVVDIAATLKRETALAYLIDDGDQEVWVPKSQVDKDGNIFTMPEWLAHEKGLI